jgi:hypothetical protein
MDAKSIAVERVAAEGRLMRGRPFGRCGEPCCGVFGGACGGVFAGVFGGALRWQGLPVTWHVVWRCGRCRNPTKEGPSTV